MWSCRQITCISERKISTSEYPIFPSLCISPSLHLSISNTSCRARSWLIRALVANASSPSPSYGNEWGSDALQLWSWKLSYWWHTEKEEEMKMRRGQMKQDEDLLWYVSTLRNISIHNTKSSVWSNEWQKSVLLFLLVLQLLPLTHHTDSRYW